MERKIVITKSGVGGKKRKGVGVGRDRGRVSMAGLDITRDSNPSISTFFFFEETKKRRRFRTAERKERKI